MFRRQAYAPHAFPIPFRRHLTRAVLGEFVRAEFFDAFSSESQNALLA